jgi:hypothetical protein
VLTCVRDFTGRGWRSPPPTLEMAYVFLFLADLPISASKSRSRALLMAWRGILMPAEDRILIWSLPPYLSEHVASCPVSFPKTHSTHPHQGRRHAAHRPRCSHLYAGVISGSGTPRPMATRLRIATGGADVEAFSRQVELALFYDAKLALT